MPKYFFFDLDKTLTKSRSPMEPDHQELFDRLCSEREVVVVSGGNREQIREQVTPRFDKRYWTLAQSGNHAIDKSGQDLWNEELDTEQIAATFDFIESLKKYFNIAVKDPNDLVENRGAQISYSVIGFHEDSEKKYAFDPDDSKRQAALAALPEELQRLTEAGIEVTPAGTTTYNFIEAGKHKGFNIKRLLDRNGWSFDECVYVGDALFPGGNDETVIGVVPTKAVTGPDDTFAFIKEMLS
ncbi:MAG: HAD-IIB family hydrolase [Candidatus Kaiserbacteria bacterium]|nr:HAD-IIB family hydrolase [Candidatus Kaiserbacteria bacterium]